MSLKAFHLIFVIVCTLFALGFALWGVREYRDTGDRKMLLLSGLSFLSGIGLVIYGRWFLKKLKGESYL